MATEKLLTVFTAKWREIYTTFLGYLGPIKNPPNCDIGKILAYNKKLKNAKKKKFMKISEILNLEPPPNVLVSI